MSDEFLKIATAEINNEISEIQKILNSCSNCNDMSANAAKIQQSTHKIKGLAPMMGKEDLGNLSALLDYMLKRITTDNITDEIFESINKSVLEMKNSMTSNNNFDEIKRKISYLSSTLS